MVLSSGSLSGVRLRPTPLFLTLRNRVTTDTDGFKYRIVPEIDGELVPNSVKA